MAARKQMLEFANFVLKFGTLDLLDLVEEIVLPTFEKPDQDLAIRNTTYRLRNVALSDLGTASSPVMCISGRFIRDTVLRRTQVFDEVTNTLRDDNDEIQSAPSALFCLILNSHKLLYLHETPFAPTLGMFESAVERMLRRERDKRIDDMHDANETARGKDPSIARLTFPQLRQRYPIPSLEITSLPSGTTIQQFLDQFEKINSLEIKLSKTNSERYMGGFFQELLEDSEELGSEVSGVFHRNSAKGLEKKPTGDQIEASSASGIGQVKVTGVRPNGEYIEGNNDSFRVKEAVEDLPKNPRDAAPQMLKIYDNHVARGVLKPGETAKTDWDKIRTLAQEVKDRHGKAD